MKGKPEALPYQIRRSVRAKRLRLLVKPGMIELVLPAKMPERDALLFLNKHKTWALTKLAEFDLKQQHSKFPAFTANITLPWRGRELPLKIQETIGVRFRVQVDDSGVLINLPQGLAETRDELALRAFYLWTRRWLQSKVAEIVARHAPRQGLNPREIRIKNMKTRWGSCGPRNDININWLLALAPESVLEYVVVHEICHIKERNHSAAFWALVAQHLPNFLEERRWIHRQGSELIRRFCL